jgi:hypothetical protein
MTAAGGCPARNGSVRPMLGDPVRTRRAHARAHIWWQCGCGAVIYSPAISDGCRPL